MLPKITIITVVRNAAQTIAHALNSVASQDYPNVEHLILDGASTDGTLEIITQFASKHAYISFESKPDKGMYFALNEGIKKASGEIIGFLHADDFFQSPDVLSHIAHHAEGVEGVYGDLVYVDPKNIEKVRRFWQSSPYQRGAFKKGWHPPHTALFLKKNVYEQYGGFDTSLKLGNDVELMMRFFEKHHIKTRYIPKVLVCMRLGGISNRSIKNIIQQNKAIMQAFSQNDLRVSWPYFLVHKSANRLKQFIKQPKEVEHDSASISDRC